MAELTKRHKRYVKQLQRRASFLEKRARDYNGKSNSYDLVEAAAIKWALGLIASADHLDLITKLERTSPPVGSRFTDQSEERDDS